MCFRSHRLVQRILNGTPIRMDLSKKIIRKSPGRIKNKIDVFLLDGHWQFPAKTEFHSYDRIKNISAYRKGIAYLAFPWATLFDAINSGHSSLVRSFVDALMGSHYELSKYQRVFTVCQHIHYADFGAMFALAAVTDAYCSHKCLGASVTHGVQIHPFPLYPVQFDPDLPVYGDKRELLFSFVGCKPDGWYISNVRQYLEKEMAKISDGLIEIKDHWHYKEAVFGEQSVDQTLNDEHYQKTLLNSVFCLCPSGSGSNTIRLWEALGAGCIPVVLSDRWDPPGGAELWELAVEFCGETPEAVAALPARLRALAEDSVALARMRARGRLIWELYGPSRFVTDILVEVARTGGRSPKLYCPRV